jgi:hypothetical protein
MLDYLHADTTRRAWILLASARLFSKIRIAIFRVKAEPPGELTVLSGEGVGDLPLDDPDLPTTGHRLSYAKRLTGGTHPLVARVLVNRVWMHHFGRGIVATPADFGTQGERPSHPELLDWLADEFMAGGWRLKRLHKMIMTSTAYR